MERVRKCFFNSRASSKAQVQAFLKDLPVGCAHPFSPEQILLCRTENGIDEIDISLYPEHFFFNAVDLGEMGEALLRRMAGSQPSLSMPSLLLYIDRGMFNSNAQRYSATSKLCRLQHELLRSLSSQTKSPFWLCLNEQGPTYYDFCFADKSCNTCCWRARHTFPGITHSGDICNGWDFLAHVKFILDSLTDEEICVFTSGYCFTCLTRFRGTHTALLVADHVDKVLHTIPVPLDAATIGDATICCPLVVKRDRDLLICSILPTATTDRSMMCQSRKLISAAFPEAITRADFTVSASEPIAPKTVQVNDSAKEDTELDPETLRKVITKGNAVFTTDRATLPPFVDLERTQIIQFGTGLEFKLPGEKLYTTEEPSAVFLPSIFGHRAPWPSSTCYRNSPRKCPISKPRRSPGPLQATREYHGDRRRAND